MIAQAAQVNRCAREQVSRGGGGRAMALSVRVPIHIPPYKKYISDIRPSCRHVRWYIIKLLLMVGKIQLWVVEGYLRIPYGMENPVVGVGTKKPRTLDTWLNSMFVI
jgi:hypothetical protein